MTQRDSTYPPDIINRKGTVLMAMSGGVDSSIAAKLLLDQDFDVVGATMRLLPNKDDEIEGTKRICDQLGIEHHVLDLQDVFERCVIDKFCNEYLHGQTPNPCVDCNKQLKFGVMDEYRASEGFDYLATGHYVRKTYDPGCGKHILKTAHDAKKDQSYFLYSLSQRILEHTLFPLGDLEKSDVRALASSCDFENADKPESQDVCFIEDGNVPDYVHALSGKRLEPGKIVDTSGKVLGEHQGLDTYTIGQRKGIGIAAREPLYVVGKDMDRNELIVGFAHEARITQVQATDVNLIHLEDLPDGFECRAKVMYRQTPQPASVRNDADGWVITFEEPLRPCAPGQAVVLYADDIVIGGGTITASA